MNTAIADAAFCSIRVEDFDVWVWAELMHALL